ncbi:S8 family serine peptidase [Nonomuraea lactucae]|uniref:S8 family serine peptidase n=1 Tax=Nonomuraea lactucae TaxID=2249762 RepID=UPI000DE2B673|nr:S8 family serine peptidase [Nonomuraea lactucae]
MRRFPALLATSLLLLGTLAALPAQRAQAGTPPEQPLPAQPPAVHDVVLVTGDVVRYTRLPDGTGRAVIEPGPGRAGTGFSQYAVRDREGISHLHVIPSDAVKLLAAGKVDRRLFDVTELVRKGLTGQSRVIVDYRDGAWRPAGGADRHLSSVNADVHHDDAAGARKLWAAVTDEGRLSSGVEGIWLDGRTRVADDASTEQIGAPQAWSAGYTGKGVPVAVLDTGYDPAHPALAGRVKEARDFSGSASGVTDTVGHGTHVAGIVAGGGGGPKSVAPDADLLIGKVCDSRVCDDSAIIAGMEWAAGRAKVINMSLGTDAPSDGTDPMSQAVNRLTATTGSLFVIAAGNAGRSGAIGSPGAADSALTVGSVDGADRLSSFSSRGPRAGDQAVKPDLTAPGERIAAARAAGTSLGDPVNDLYTRLSGTSMATPHVAGAAALLLQRHPDWTPARVKAVLTGSAAPASGVSSYDQGSGRLDLARAVRQQVTPRQGSVTFGLLAWPYRDLPDLTRTVTYVNDGDAPVTLRLALDAPGLSDAVSVGASSVTVPAHGTADVPLVLDPGAVTRAGPAGGRLVATGDGTVVQTAFGVTAETESYDVTFELVGRDGEPASDLLPQEISGIVLDPETDDPFPWLTVEGGRAVARVPVGEYGLAATVRTATGAPGDLATADVAALFVPAFKVDRAGIVVTADARTAHEVTTRVETPGTVREWAALDAIFSDGPKTYLRTMTAVILFGSSNRLYTATAVGDPDRFDFGYTTSLVSPSAAYHLAFPFRGEVPEDTVFEARRRELADVDTTYRSQGVDSATGRRAQGPWYLSKQFVAYGGASAVTLPSRRVEYFTPRPVEWKESFEQGPANRPQGIVFSEGSYPLGSHTRHWNDAVVGPDLSRPAANWVVRAPEHIQAIVPSFVSSGAGLSGSPLYDYSYVQGETTLARDGQVIGKIPYAGLGSWKVPRDTGRYTLTVDARRDPDWSVLSPRVTTEWTFTSGVPEAASELPALPLVTVTGDFDERNRAPGFAWFPLKLQVENPARTRPVESSKLSLEMSHDDGRTWRQVWVLGDEGNLWDAVVFHPGKAGTSGRISLRIHAANDAGNEVTQTIIGAYGLR